MKIDKAIELFLLDCKLKRLKKRSISTYTIHLNHFKAFCVANNKHTVNEVDTFFLKDYSLFISNKSIAYQRNLLGNVNLLFSYLLTDGLITTKPKIRLPKKIVRVKDILSKEEISKILKACNNAKQRLMILVLLDTGMRINEMINLKLEDTDLNKGIITIREGKSGERFVSFGNKTKKALLIFIEDRERGFLFLTNSEKKYTLSGVNKVFKGIRKRSGVHHFTAHACRRTMITNSIRSKMPLDILMRISGHTDFETIKDHYLKTDVQDLIDAQQEYGLVDNL